jgi:hypothetical protein
VAGLKPASFAQKLWRFCADPRVGGADLIEPLHAAIRREDQTRPGVLLAIHDWSTLAFGGHPSKPDRARLTHEHDLGYDLATVLLARGDDGAPIAPAVVRLRTAAGVLATHDDPPAAEVPHVDQVRDDMRRTAELGLTAAVVHVVDREADSVAHWRRWAADSRMVLVRADDRKVLHRGLETTLAAVADGLRHDDALKDVGAALYRGRTARLLVGEAAVVLHRPGRRNRLGGKKMAVPGPPLALRLVVAEVRDLEGRVLARWLLLTNAPAELGDAATVARWYYFRWRIEGLHKLLKSAGWQLEGWLQRDGPRVFRKLLLALAACASIWALERRRDAASAAFRALLMQLSGRQTKRGRATTTSGMLAGLWVLQGALGPLARHGPEELNAMLGHHLPLFAIRK